MRILVTGATGFIGRYLSFKLAEQGYNVVALCRNVNHPYLIPHKNITAVKGDILDRPSLISAMKDCQQVYHTAALAKMWRRDKNDYYNINVAGTRNVLELAMDLYISKIVYTSTCGVWGPTIKHPMTENDPRIDGFAIDYERTKYLAEIETRIYANKGLNVVTVNPSRVYGEGPITDSNTVGKMIYGYLKGKWRIIPGKGTQVSNYAYLDDVVNGHIAAMEQGEPGNRYILGGEDISFNTFFDTLQNISGKSHNMIRLPQRIIEAYSHFEKLKTSLTGLPPVFLPEFAARLRRDQKYSSQKAIAKLNYHITPFAEGMAKTINHIKNL
ncbi:NAD-dependent epimerase/dehydratase family protein [Mucilaginibacter sp. L3T2-6]|uniref:NAD-dependent epimerase/dehydratase family protein n=1 Tax=Mucilaginibacter sp. L3T2-6 TaxID=3062491 RepID=UPI0026746A3B|nr:NAD-dependent epimerase/dehydratase family protein [Mucilaginibacter sp. L3T2-6]MDO3642078.1 NAD-dependent epimerase/dehydratase family protein [Mucilaginibacter sp. L3T2-6]MDV6214572.1 NAD-dependent epimerase/dehydratase family protein [Mucilaginibacter sp. L3T2-6]